MAKIVISDLYPVEEKELLITNLSSDEMTAIQGGHAAGTFAGSVAIGGLIGSFGGPVGIAGGVVVGAIVGGVLAGIEQLVLPD